MNTETMKIIGVAVKQGDLMICLAMPNRHHHCIDFACQVLGLDPPIYGEQGFYLADGTFLNREVAREYAIMHHDIIPRNDRELFSEDLW